MAFSDSESNVTTPSAAPPRRDKHPASQSHTRCIGAQVRRAWRHFGFDVARLIRVGYGPFILGGLPAGECEEVPPERVRALQERGEGSVDGGESTGGGPSRPRDV